MNRYIAASAAIIAGLLSVSHANAQLAVAKVVANCGTVSPTPHAGSTYALTIDITGTLCTVGGGGGGGGTSSNFGAPFPGAGTAAGFEYLTSAPTLTNGQMVAGQTDVNGNLKVNVVSGGSANASVSATGSAVPASATYAGITVAGTLTGWPGTATGGNVNPGTATLWGILTQGSTTSGQSGQLMMGAVTTAAPSYTTAQTSPLSLDTAGNLRVNVVTGGGTGGTSSTYGASFPTTGTGAGFKDASGNMAAGNLDASGNLKVSGGSIQSTTSVAWTASSSTVAQVIALSGSTKIYITSWDGVTDGAASGNGTFQIVYGTGTNCATGQTALTPAYNFSAGNGIAKGSGIGSLFTTPAGQAICIKSTTTNAVEGTISYLQQ